jgi:predicted Rossmann fold nucleotide-binding protein DprA/Smf involved in DNA uptake
VKPREKIKFGVAISAYRPFRPFSKFNFSRRNDDKD